MVLVVLPVICPAISLGHDGGDSKRQHVFIRSDTPDGSLAGGVGVQVNQPGEQDGIVELQVRYGHVGNLRFHAIDGAHPDGNLGRASVMRRPADHLVSLDQEMVGRIHVQGNQLAD